MGQQLPDSDAFVWKFWEDGPNLGVKVQFCLPRIGGEWQWP